MNLAFYIGHCLPKWLEHILVLIFALNNFICTYNHPKELHLRKLLLIHEFQDVTWVGFEKEKFATCLAPHMFGSNKDGNRIKKKYTKYCTKYILEIPLL